MENHYNDRVVQLLQLYLTGEITDVEQRELEAWCQENERNRLFFEHVREERLFAEERALYQKIDLAKALRAFENRARGVKMFRNGVGRWWKYAAAVFLPLFAVGILLVTRQENPSVETLAAGDIQPGCAQAVLVLDNGQKMSLNGEVEGEIVENEEITATREKGKLVYVPGGESMDETQFNTLVIPRGGEYKVVLSDGTNVYLNSATRLKYPVVFNGKERKVYLTGEAYFEVTKDAKRPFLVKTKGVEVKVYGTSFNVNSRGEERVQTVLVEGSVGVKVLASGEECLIKPGQMAEIAQGKMDVKEVNVALYTDWKNGIFRFENQRLEDILSVLSDWYDADVFYREPSVKELHFSGYMERYKDFRKILGAITLSTGVSFSVQGKTIIVSR